VTAEFQEGLKLPLLKKIMLPIDSLDLPPCIDISNSNAI
jgi:hypothetical protein